MRLIINGDDFGITHACNLALKDSFENGMMTSTSMMVNMPGAEEAAQIWEEHPDWSVGIHLNLTVGKPLCQDLKTLVRPDGTFRKENLDNPEADVDPEEIRRECRAQIERFVQLNGRMPDHLNSHHGIERIRGGAEVMLELQKEYQLPLRSFVVTPEGVDTSRCLFEIAEQKSMPYDCPEIFPENFFTQEELDSDRCFEWVQHPGYVDWDLMQISSLTEGRALDAQRFQSAQTREWIQNHAIERISYRDLGRKERLD